MIGKTPLSPKRIRNNLKLSPRHRRRISVDSILNAGLSDTASKLCSPSSYRTKNQNETTNENVQTGGLLAQAPTPSRPIRSQCLQGLPSSHADAMLDAHHRPQPQQPPLQPLQPLQPPPLMPTSMKGNNDDPLMVSKQNHALEWKTQATPGKQQKHHPSAATWGSILSTPPTLKACTKMMPPTLSASAPWQVATPVAWQQSPLQQHQQHQIQQVAAAAAAAALWQAQQQQQLMYMQLMSQQHTQQLTQQHCQLQQQQRHHRHQPKHQHTNYGYSAQNNMNALNYHDGAERHHRYRRHERGNDRGNDRSSSRRNGGRHFSSSSSSSSSSSFSTVVVEQWKNAEDRQHWTISRIFGNLAKFAQDSTGTHFVQTCMDDASESQIVRAYEELSSSMSSLLHHNTANWSVKKLVELLRPRELEEFLQQHVVGKVNSMAYHVHGARVVKAALIRAASFRTAPLVDIANDILNDLGVDMVRAMCHESATHIFQRAFNVLGDVPESRAKIVKKIVQCDLTRIGTHTFGSRALQCVISMSASDMAPAVLIVAPVLAQSAAGNFVLQSMLQNGDAAVRKDLVAVSTYHLGEFSCNKHASHFVERCIDMASEEELTKMVQTMSSPLPTEMTIVSSTTATTATTKMAIAQPIMVMMCNNSYANFVVGSIVARLQHTGQATLKSTLAGIMQMWEPQMRASNVGDKTYSQSVTALAK